MVRCNDTFYLRTHSELLFLDIEWRNLENQFFYEKNIFHRHGRNVGTMLSGIVSRLGGLTLRAMPPTLPIVGCGSSSYIGD